MPGRELGDELAVGLAIGKGDGESAVDELERVGPLARGAGHRDFRAARLALAASAMASTGG